MLFDTLRYYWTLWKWKRCAHHRKRPNIRLGNLQDFFRQLNEEKVSYVVLRWFDNIPLTKEAEKRNGGHGDVDILADGNDLLKVCKAVAMHPGKIKLDLCSNSLVLATDIKRFTFFPPVLCRDLLESRIMDERSHFFRPDDRTYLYSLTYHIVYHKGLQSGLPSGFSDLPQQPPKNNRHDPEGTLRQLAKAVGETLPEEFNLLQLHLWLKKRGWNMPLDLLLRWPRQHELLPRLYKYESDSLRQALGNHQNLCVYLLREDAIKAGATEQILAELRTHYRILDTVTFTPDQQDRVIRRTRGGNWTKRKQLRLFLPEVAVVCQALVPFTPMDDTAAASSEQKENNPDILFKVALRKKMAEQFPDASDFLHGSDNDIESMEYIQAIYGDDAWQAKWVEFFPDK